MKKLMDFCGSAEVLMAMLDHCIIESEIHKLDSGTKVTMMIFVEEGQQNMQGNNLKVSICDTMQMADAFIKSTAIDGMKWADENRAKPVEVKYEVSTDGVNWVDDLRYGETIGENWSESDEDRMRVVISNGNDGAAYEPVDGRGDDAEVV